MERLRVLSCCKVVGFRAQEVNQVCDTFHNVANIFSSNIDGLSNDALSLLKIHGKHRMMITMLSKII